MTAIDLLSFVGGLVSLAAILTGVRCWWLWIAAGFALQERQMRLGRAAMDVADEVLDDVRVPVLPMRVK